MALITASHLNLAFGESRILDDAEFVVEEGERLCITGRNGAGKSTLLRLIAGEIEADSGSIWRQGGIEIATLEQTLPEAKAVSVFDHVAAAFADTGDLLAQYHHLLETIEDEGFDARRQKHLDRLQASIDHADGWRFDHRISAVLDRLGLDGRTMLATLSGGWRRRVGIARSLVTEPDLWLLDEPTNHLDIPAIEWLEETLLQFGGTLVFVSHDRRLMQRIGTAILDLDRGRLTRWNCDYASFLNRKTHQLEVEATHQRAFDKRLAREEAWIREGIKARRTRNEGRVRALRKLREERAKRRQTGELKLEVDAGERSGKLVKVALGLTKIYDGKPVIKDLDLVIQRGDRIGILGPNGAGKSTLLRLLLEQEAPDAGTVDSGTRLEVAYFDQIRGGLDPEKTVADTISDGREYVMVGGKNTHVVTWLSNFLFTPDQARSKVRVLSGGEQNRLLLAKLFSLPANLLVMDEPTNDLDIESLEMLEELLIDYEGTVLLVTHDRAFLDNVVSSLLVFEGKGVVREYVGGYSDWVAAGGRFYEEAAANDGVDEARASEAFETRKREKRARQKIERELAALPGRIDDIESQIAALHETMARPGFFDQPETERRAIEERLAAAEAERDQLFARWEELES